jgi:hypothetical protein
MRCPRSAKQTEAAPRALNFFRGSGASREAFLRIDGEAARPASLPLPAREGGVKNTRTRLGVGSGNPHGKAAAQADGRSNQRSS